MVGDRETCEENKKEVVTEKERIETKRAIRKKKEGRNRCSFPADQKNEDNTIKNKLIKGR